MLSIAHATAGALIATKVGNPILAAPLILASHYLLDYVPHWDFGQGLSKNKKSKKVAFFQELLIDFPLSIFLVYFFFRDLSATTPAWLPWYGWFLGLLPDFVEFPARFLNWNFFPFKQHQAFHHGLHHSIPQKIKGLIPQFIVIALTLIFR